MKWKNLLKRIRKFIGYPNRPVPKRICNECKKPMRKHHKYFFDGGTVRHRDCEKPTGEVVENKQAELIP